MLRAQIPPDSIGKVDSVPVDTSNLDETSRYLAAQAKGAHQMSVLSQLGVEGPRPGYSRLEFNQDSLAWAGSETLGDLLRSVPDVYVLRAGWIGRSEYLDYAGRGSTSVEYYQDGMPLIPIGPDSVAVDPSFQPLSLLQRVVIERWPGVLRVLLYTRQHDRQAPASRIGISTGDRQYARYIGALEYRLGKGWDISFGGDYASVNQSGSTSNESSGGQYRIQVGYVPNNHFGVNAQVVLTTAGRVAVLDADTLSRPVDGNRQDETIRVSWGTGPERLGLHLDGLLMDSHWTGQGFTNDVRQGGILANFRLTRLQVGGSIFNRSRWTPWDLRANAGWQPIDRVTVSGELGYQTHDVDRSSHWIGLRGGIQLPLSFYASAALRSGSIVSAPAIFSEQAHKVSDWSATVGFETRPLAVSVEYGHLSAFQPSSYFALAPIDSFRPTVASNRVTVNWRLAPVQWFYLSGFYSDPIKGGQPDGSPPTHSLSSVTFRSRFWRKYPSGTFEIKAQFGLEAWSDWTVGLIGGVPVTLRGGTWMRALLQIRLQQFILFWDRQNLQGVTTTYAVPGLTTQPYANRFGFRWEFSN
ncbi:MAG: hypothetical protein ABI765_05630 [Gemmatimonadota bacterium]